MDKNNPVIQIFLFSIFLGVILVTGSFVLPWQMVKWGTIGITPGQTVTVVGQAQTQQKNEVATFSAGVTSVNDNKDTAVAEVNQKVEKIIEAAKTFGIPAEDLKTQNLSVYQSEEVYYDNGVQKSRLGQWRVNNTVEIKLRDVDRAAELTDLITKSGANNVYGPNFTIDNTNENENKLLEEAIKNAKEKATTIATSTGRKLGKVLSVSEGTSQNPIYAFEKGLGGVGGTPVEPGSQTVSKSITITFELL